MHLLPGVTRWRARDARRRPGVGYHRSLLSRRGSMSLSSVSTNSVRQRVKNADAGSGFPFPEHIGRAAGLSDRAGSNRGRPTRVGARRAGDGARPPGRRLPGEAGRRPVAPIARAGWRTEVSGTVAAAANSMSSYPTMARSSGTLTPGRVHELEHAEGQQVVGAEDGGGPLGQTLAVWPRASRPAATSRRSVGISRNAVGARSAWATASSAPVRRSRTCLQMGRSARHRRWNRARRRRGDGSPEHRP